EEQKRSGGKKDVQLMSYLRSILNMSNYDDSAIPALTIWRFQLIKTDIGAVRHLFLRMHSDTLGVSLNNGQNGIVGQFAFQLHFIP
ncbi:hypothetical protein, partial [Xenorhabdus eapokensis]|uniref:hypothetical protein n=1 Tax=Xenorhabdus eapokensis TaxID=1873482 RepID=UPI001ABF4758